MMWRPAVVVPFLLGVGLTSVLALPPSNASLHRPELIGCVFIERVKVTCRWVHKRTTYTNYTLSIWEIPMKKNHSFSRVRQLNCSSTTTSCSVAIITCRQVFCVEVTAHTGSGEISSEPRCQAGRFEVKLPSVRLKSVTAWRGSSDCLIIMWHEPDWNKFPVSHRELENGHVNFQIETREEGEHRLEVKDVTVTGFWFTTCGFRPNTLYNIALRHRYRGAASPWSEWSLPLGGRTGEAAPSIAPVFWRRVKSSAGRWRHVTLLWKPVPPQLANGRVLFYSVTCRTERSPDRVNLEGCRDLDVTKTSCGLRLPDESCSCGLTASTSAGASPEARLWFRGTTDKVPTWRSGVNVTSLDNHSLVVGWWAPTEQPASGFVVEWIAVREKNRSSVLYWEKLNQSTTAVVITEGLKPMERFAVSVRALCGKQQMAGESSTRFVYTREGTPSAGPLITASEMSSHGVKFTWSPVPVEELHGFLRNYTVYITGPQRQIRNFSVRGDSVRHTLENLSPGNYQISVGANTDGGIGPAGIPANVHIAAGTPMMAYVFISVGVTTLAVVMMLLVYLANAKIVNKKLCRYIPNPSHSTLSHWIPETNMKKKQFVVPEKLELNSSEVVLLREVDNSDPDGEEGYKNTCNVQIHLSKMPPLQFDVARNMLFKQSAQIKTASVTDLSTRPFILSDIHFHQIFKNPSTLFLPSSDCRWNALSGNGMKQLPGGAGEAPAAPPAGEAFGLSPKLHQSLCSLPNVSGASVPPPAEVGSSQRTFSSFPSLHSDASAPPCAPSHSSTAPFQPFSNSLFVDFSYCPVQCDPYIPSAM